MGNSSTPVWLGMASSAFSSAFSVLIDLEDGPIDSSSILLIF